MSVRPQGWCRPATDTCRAGPGSWPASGSALRTCASLLGTRQHRYHTGGPAALPSGLVSSWLEEDGPDEEGSEAASQDEDREHDEHAAERTALAVLVHVVLGPPVLDVARHQPSASQRGLTAGLLTGIAGGSSVTHTSSSMCKILHDLVSTRTLRADAPSTAGNRVRSVSIWLGGSAPLRGDVRHEQGQG